MCMIVLCNYVQDTVLQIRKNQARVLCIRFQTTEKIQKKSKTLDRLCLQQNSKIPDNTFSVKYRRNCNKY